ncbi:MAG: hypothetical protein NTV86_10790, partial [Planctomycetota bacterium]|nr:hypothetical protein [Planctomycetota bacterium]
MLRNLPCVATAGFQEMHDTHRVTRAQPEHAPNIKKIYAVLENAIALTGGGPPLTPQSARAHWHLLSQDLKSQI